WTPDAPRQRRRGDARARTGARADCAGTLAGDPDLAASHPRAGIARRLAEVVVRIGMHDHRAVGDVVEGAAAQGDATQVHVDQGHARPVGDQVVHVAGVVAGPAGAAVRGALRVEVAAGAAGVHRAAITLLVHVEAEVAVGLQSADLAQDVHPVAR